MILIIPGFISDSTRFEPFTRELTRRGYETVVVNRHHKRRPIIRPDEAYAEAIYETVRRLSRPPTTIIAHSYGFIALAAFIRIYQAQLPWLRDVYVVGLAPAGLIGRSTFPNQLKRFVSNYRLESDRSVFEDPQLADEVFTRGVGNLKQHLLLSALEGTQISITKIDLDWLKTTVNQIIVIGFIDDAFITTDRLLQYAPEAIIFEYLLPLTHDSPLYQPAVVVELLKPYLVNE